MFYRLCFSLYICLTAQWQGGCRDTHEEGKWKRETKGSPGTWVQGGVGNTPLPFFVSQTTFDTFHQSQHRLYTLHKSFYAFQLCFYLLEIIEHNMPKMLLFFLPSSVLKWLQKNSPILVSIFKCTLIRQLSQYNVTKLF